MIVLVPLVIALWVRRKEAMQVWSGEPRVPITIGRIGRTIKNPLSQIGGTKSQTGIGCVVGVYRADTVKRDADRE